MMTQVRLSCSNDDYCPCYGCHLAGYCGGVCGGLGLWCPTMFVLVVSVTLVCVVVFFCCVVVLPSLGFLLFNIIDSFA